VNDRNGGRREKTVGVQIDVAGPDDDAALRRLLAENPIPGAFTLAFVREPCFFHGASVEGDTQQTIIARPPGEERCVGLGSRAVRTVFLDGEPTRLGYLSQLRIDRAYRDGGGLLSRGFAVMKRLHDEAADVPFYVTTIIEGNQRAVRALTRARPCMPTYLRREVISTLAIPMWRRRRLARSTRFVVRRGSPEDLDDVAACLQRCYRHYQFAPCWTGEDLAHPERTRDLAASDFFIATWRGQVIGCVARWDQSAFKQTTVHGYTGALARLKPAYNAVAGCIGAPRLPDVGARLGHAYLSHIAVERDDPEVLGALLGAAFDASLGHGFAYLTLALAARNPLLAVAKRAFRHFEYRAGIYTVHWDDGAEAVRRIGSAPISHLELACL
jgi:hypothetical protein